MLQILKTDPLDTLLDNPVTAILYENGKEIENLLAGIADHLKVQGYKLAGYIQRDRPKSGRSDCDMMLEDVATGTHYNISEDRGAAARGCKLDLGALLEAGEKLVKAIDEKPDMLILNKFGKSEHEGGGLRPLIARAIELDIPVLIAVPLRNIESWRDFAGEFAVEIQAERFAD